MVKQKNSFYFLHLLRFYVYWFLDRFDQALGQSGHSMISLSETLLMLNWGPVLFKSCIVYCSLLYKNIWLHQRQISSAAVAEINYYFYAAKIIQ